MLRLQNPFDVLLKYSQWLNVAQRAEGQLSPKNWHRLKKKPTKWGIKKNLWSNWNLRFCPLVCRRTYMLMHCWRYSSGKSCIPTLQTWLTPGKWNIQAVSLDSFINGPESAHSFISFRNVQSNLIILCNSSFYVIYLPSNWKFLLLRWLEKRKTLLHDNKQDPDYSKEWSLLEQGLLYWGEEILCNPILCYQLKALQAKIPSRGLFKPNLNQKSLCRCIMHMPFSASISEAKNSRDAEKYPLIHHVPYLSGEFL